MTYIVQTIENGMTVNEEFFTLESAMRRYDVIDSMFGQYPYLESVHVFSKHESGVMIELH